MKQVMIAAAVLAVSGGLAGCETTASYPYQPSTRNVIALQSKAKTTELRKSVAAFDAAPGLVGRPTCRAMGPVDVAPGKSVPQYIAEALQQELFLAGLYDVGAAKISGTVNEIKLDTVGSGSWTISVTVRSPAYPDGYTVITRYEFSSSWSAASACQNAAAAFSPAVQDLLGKIFEDKRFELLD
jgi:hypothetical protein